MKLLEKLLENTGRISLEISNRCNYAHVHDRCPASKATEPISLPAPLVYRVLDFLGKEGFGGKICFHTYNEPLVDPRLITFIRMARAACRRSDIFIYTNGFMLSQNMLNDLVEAGVTSLRASAYTDAEYERLAPLTATINYFVERMDIKKRWIERIEVYEQPENGSKEPCFAPLCDIQIDHQGRVRLCCVDWKSRIIYGDLRKELLKDVLEMGSMQKTFNELRKGERTIDLCRRCGTRRRIR